MEDVRDLKELQLDALREVANIGAGHAATALSQMTNRTIMIDVPEVNVRAARGRRRAGRPRRRGDRGGPDAHDGRPHRPHAGPVPRGGRPATCATSCCAGAPGPRGEFGAMEQSGLKEAGNILASAYLNALSDFMGMMLVPSVPSLVVDLSARGPHHRLPQLRPRARLRLLRRDRVPGRGRDRAAARALPAPARHAVAAGHLRRHSPVLNRCRGPCSRSAISPSCAPSPAASIRPTPARTTTSASSTTRRG